MRGKFLPKRRAPGPRPIFLNRRRWWNDADFCDAIIGWSCALGLVLLIAWLVGERLFGQ